jgi:protein TonB
MRSPTPLQICFGISISLHVAVISLCRIYGVGPFNATSGPEKNSDAAITLTLVAAPEEPAAPETIPQETPSSQPSMPEPIEMAVSVDPKQPKQPEPESIVPTPVPLPTAVASIPRSRAIINTADTPKETVEPIPVVIAQPDYLKNTAPVYPASARRRHEQGLVLLTVEVTTEGHARKVNIKKSSGFETLDAAAVQAVENWEFQPARVGLVSLESEVEVPIRFELARH